MEQTINTEICDGCGKNEVLFEKDGNEFCSECHALVEILKQKPELVQNLCKLTKTQLDAEQTILEEKDASLPDVLDAVRFRTHDREQNTWYVSVSEIKGEPVEIFASTAFDRDQHLQSRISKKRN